MLHHPDTGQHLTQHGNRGVTAQWTTVDFAAPVRGQALRLLSSSSSGLTETVIQAVSSAVGLFMGHSGQPDPERRASVGCDEQTPQPGTIREDGMR